MDVWGTQPGVFLLGQVIKAGNIWTLLINDIDKASQVFLIDFSEPIPKEQDVIKKKQS